MLENPESSEGARGTSTPPFEYEHTTTPYYLRIYPHETTLIDVGWISEPISPKQTKGVYTHNENDGFGNISSSRYFHTYLRGRIVRRLFVNSPCF